MGREAGWVKRMWARSSGRHPCTSEPSRVQEAAQLSCALYLLYLLGC